MSEKGNTLYLECNAGISGDMAVAALLDLGADQERLQKVLESIPVHGFQIKISRVKKAGLDVCDFDVILDKKHENHDHDMEYLHGEENHHSHESNDHGHTHHHEHRGLSEILDVIRKTDMTERAKETADRIFQILAEAEAKAHGVPVDEVHFHEVGAVDSIVDVIAAAVCLDDLGITECIVPILCEGTGTVRCQHGIMPVPVPAVLNIVQDAHLKLRITDVQGEFVTPTGAAIAAAVKTGDALPRQFRIMKIGMGAGKRAYEKPSILRAMLIEAEEEKGIEQEIKQGTEQKTEHGKEQKTGQDAGAGMESQEYDTDVIYKLESNIDDCSGEALGYVMERLREAGARDVHYIPVYMKKNRPAYQLNVICDAEKIPQLERIIFTETTTIGIRRQKMERSVLARQTKTVQTDLGEAKVKVCMLPEKRYYPEYDSIVTLCSQSGKPWQEVYHMVLEAAIRQNSSERR